MQRRCDSKVGARQIAVRVRQVAGLARAWTDRASQLVGLGRKRPAVLVGLVLVLVVSGWIERRAMHRLCGPLGATLAGGLDWLGVLTALSVSKGELPRCEGASSYEELEVDRLGDGPSSPNAMESEGERPQGSPVSKTRRSVRNTSAGGAAVANSDARGSRSARNPGLGPTDSVGGGGAGPGKVSSIDVSAEAVRRAIPTSGRPNGVLVAAQGDHPGGIQIRNPGVLRGVIRPGDILTEAEGQPIRTWETLVGIVTRAYGKSADAVHGKLWREGVLFSVAVHIPYGPPPSSQRQPHR